ncbi:dolichyl-diphosphooligosaccharide--protein glycosyltransferase, putative [Plasmodium gallinaceum]|uniref:Dolichyl-diphosphooligosaccharide--protein glycosyltransferase 48 kDa subunit n=1 Tax=Plasmodium gallinaceum TaxID=5849 RepID=A0A1J1GWV7_PLAGA|nr:dolichyl-diphosphooligosaccharide--protein glycosyltransferase, putative [Plasmodium gallinaceum]CRG96743.1 dolichyl-diphosphooligosaccharide--protein glycosyltransferase, putative [Plasmodium gallinaceum]
MKIIIKIYFFLLFFVIKKKCICERKKLEIVDYNKKSIEGIIKNKIKKFHEKKLLLITNIINITETHRSFINLLNNEGNHIKNIINIHNATNSIIFDKKDSSIYDGLVIILDILNDEIVTKLKVSYLKLFIEKKKHIFFSLNSVVGKNSVHFLNELNISVHGNYSYVNDIFDNIFLKEDTNDEKLQKSFYTSEIIQNTPITNNKHKILFKGTAHSVLLKEKYYLKVLTCTKTCLLYGKNNNIIKKQKQGTELLLISSIQLENNFRLIFSSSSDIFSDFYFDLNEENKNFTYDLIQWNLKKIGVIRYNNFKIHKRTFKENSNFFIKDTIYISIDFYELRNNYWIPFKRDDIQYQLIKINVKSRNFLYNYKCIKNATYYKNIKLPGEHGIYKFQIYYLRKGYNILNLEYFLPVRNLLHYDKNKKVNFKNYPFYFYMYLSLLYFFLFTLILIFDDSDYNNKKKKK